MPDDKSATHINSETAEEKDQTEAKHTGASKKQVKPIPLYMAIGAGVLLFIVMGIGMIIWGNTEALKNGKDKDSASKNEVNTGTAEPEKEYWPQEPPENIYDTAKEYTPKDANLVSLEDKISTTFRKIFKDVKLTSAFESSGSSSTVILYTVKKRYSRSDLYGLESLYENDGWTKVTLNPEMKLLNMEKKNPKATLTIEFARNGYEADVKVTGIKK